MKLKTSKRGVRVRNTVTVVRPVRNGPLARTDRRLTEGPRATRRLVSTACDTAGGLGGNRTKDVIKLKNLFVHRQRRSPDITVHVYNDNVYADYVF